MIRVFLTAGFALLAIGPTPTQQYAPSASGWRSLFDGKTTAGWRGFKQKQMPDGWSVIR